MKRLSKRNVPQAQSALMFRGVDLGSMVFTSGQIPVCPQTGEIPADVQDQARLSPRKRQSDRGCCRAERGRYHQDDRVHHRSE